MFYISNFDPNSFFGVAKAINTMGEYKHLFLVHRQPIPPDFDDVFGLYNYESASGLWSVSYAGENDEISQCFFHNWCYPNDLKQPVKTAYTVDDINTETIPCK